MKKATHYSVIPEIVKRLCYAHVVWELPQNTKGSSTLIKTLWGPLRSFTVKCSNARKCLLGILIKITTTNINFIYLHRKEVIAARVVCIFFGKKAVITTTSVARDVASCYLVVDKWFYIIIYVVVVWDFYLQLALSIYGRNNGVRMSSNKQGVRI